MAATGAAGQRFPGVCDHPPIAYLELAGFLRERYGQLPPGRRPPTAGDELPRLTIHNDRAKNEPGWRLRSAEDTITDTVDSLRERGELGQPRQCRSQPPPFGRVPHRRRPGPPG